MSALTLAATMLCVAPAVAQTPAPGWILIVRIVPNPMPIGRCGGVTVELQDDEGYRRNELSNGGVIDFHKFRYTADTTNFQWQNGNPVDGVICTRAGAPPSSITVTVTLPDGLSGSAQLTSKAVGEYAQAVQYAKQGPLRRPGVPPPHASTAPANAAPTRTSSGAPSKMSTSSRAAGVTTSALGMTGSYFAGAAASVTTSALGMTGSYFAGAATSVTTSALGMTGSYFAGAAASVTTSALGMTGSFFASASTAVTTSALGMTGSYFAGATTSVTTSALSMTGTSSSRAPKTGTTPGRVPY